MKGREKRMKNRTCYKCKYVGTCGDPKRTKPCDGYAREIDKEKAKAFWNDFKGIMYHGDLNHGTSGIVSEEFVADRMGISVEKATEFLWAAVKYELTDRQGGGFVI